MAPIVVDRFFGLSGIGKLRNKYGNCCLPLRDDRIHQLRVAIFLVLQSALCAAGVAAFVEVPERELLQLQGGTLARSIRAREHGEREDGT